VRGWLPMKFKPQAVEEPELVERTA
jgi:hypothetical protein